MKVIPIPLGVAQAFLVKDEGAILIDTGSPGCERRLLAALRHAGVEPRDVRLILHTHGHYDHCGSTHALRQHMGAPAALHGHDVHLVRKGFNDPLRPINAAGHLVKLISNRRFAAFEPELIIEHEMDLEAYGVRGRIIFTPGHTAGSVSVLLQTGEAIVGDLMMGGFLGGKIFCGRPGHHFFADDLEILRTSIHKLMGLDPTRVYVAHGGPLEPRAIRERFQREIAFAK